MKFLISQELKQGKYFVRVTLTEFSEDDKIEANVFGMPTLMLKFQHDRNATIPITNLEQFPSYGFSNQIEADKYAAQLKEQIINLKNIWDKQTDTWSKQEEI